MKNIILYYLLFFPMFLFAQNDYIVDIQHFSTENGLSQREAHIVYQDSEGFIWIGTEYGLNRFDGHDFKIFSKEKNGLASNDITWILEDNQGWLWIQSTTPKGQMFGLSFLNVKTLEVQTVEERFGERFPLNWENISGLEEGDNNEIFISGEGKIFKFHNDQFEKKHETDKYISISNIGEYAGYLVGRIELSPNHVEVFLFGEQIELTGIKLNQDYLATIYKIIDKDGTIRIVSEGQLYEKRDNQWKSIGFNKLLNINEEKFPFPTMIFPQNENRYWFSDNKQLVLHEPYKGIILDLGKQYPEIIKANTKWLFFDEYDNIWVITDFGVYKVRLTESKFENYLHQPFQDYNLATAFSSRGLVISDNQLWANSTKSDGFIINLKTKEQKQISKPINYFDNGNQKIDLVYRPVFKEAEGKIYHGSEELFYYENERFVKRYSWKSSQEESMLWAIHQDEKQNLLLGTLSNGIGIVNGDSIEYYDKYNDFGDLKKSSIYHFLNWDKNHVFIASTSGLYLLHTQKGVVQRFWLDGNQVTKLPFDVIHHIHRDKKEQDKLWLATSGGGLIMCQLSEDLMEIEALEQFTIVDGLSNNVLYAVYEDDYNNLWLPSDYGLMRFNKITKSSTAYTQEDGIPFNEFNRTAHFQNDDGQLFFGTMNGVTSFYPKKLLDIQKTSDTPLRITNFQQFNGKANKLEDKTTALLQQNQIVLKPSDKFFNLSFALLEYKDANEIKYSYQIKGQSDEWIYLDNNKLRISGLPYGNFTLNVRAQGISGQFSSKTLSIPIRVLRPFYLQWWFFVVLAALIGFSVYYWYQQRTKGLIERQQILEKTVAERTAQIQKDKNTIEKQAEELRSLDAAKSRFFANVSHELRTPLTLILAPIENSLKRNRLENKDFTNLKMAKNNGQLLLKMVNEILDLSKLEAGKLSLNETVFNGFQHFNNIVENFIPLANEKQIDYQFNFEGDKSVFVKLDKQKIQVILINLLSNAFKFTPNNGQILVDVQLNNNLTIKVKDSGRGIHSDDLEYIFDRFYQTKNKATAAEGGTGIGLALVKELVELMEGAVKVESELSKGTTFNIAIPYVKVIHQEENNTVEQEDEKELFIHAQTNLMQKTNTVYLKSATKSTTYSTKKATILLVEDNPDLRQFIASLLEKSYEVITAENGAIGWEKLQSSAVDLILSDVMMPVLDGYGLLKKVKTSKEFHQTPMVMLTAKASIDDKLNALRIGVDDYLTKPFIEEELLVRIHNLLQNAAVRKITISEIVEEETTQNNNTTTSNENTNEPEKEVIFTITEEQQKWLDKLETIILTNIEKSDYTVENLALDMATSKRQLHRNIKQYIGLTPNRYIRFIRLTKARQLLESNEVDSVKSAAYSVGFKDVTYFSKLFKSEFGVIPSVV